MAKHKMKIVQTILKIFMTLVFVYFLAGQITMPNENLSEESTFGEYEGTWVNVRPDGEKVTVSVPGQIEAERGEWVTLETTLPQSQKNETFRIRSMQQELRIYVDGELRKEYSTLATQPVGKTSTLTYVFFDVSSEDAGKTLRIESMSLSHYSGYTSFVYTGEK